MGVCEKDGLCVFGDDEDGTLVFPYREEEVSICDMVEQVSGVDPKIAHNSVYKVRIRVEAVLATKDESDAYWAMMRAEREAEQTEWLASHPDYKPPEDGIYRVA